MAAVIAVLSAVAAVLSAWSGFSYGDFGDEIGFQTAGGWFITVGLLGGTGLAGFGAAQWVGGRSRLFLLVVLVFVAAGTVAAHAFGLFILREVNAEAIPRALHRTGLVVGALLLAAVFLDLARILLAYREVRDDAR